MMKTYIIRLTLLITILAPFCAKAQYCNNFHTEYCSRSESGRYKLNGQSKSALFTKGKKSELNIIVYQGQDYRLSVCMEDNIGGQLEFKIYETNKVESEKTFETKTIEDEYKTCSVCNGEGYADEETCYECDGEGQVATGNQIEVVNKETRLVKEKKKEMIYDNSQDGYSSEIEFSVETTRRLTLEINVPGAENTSKLKLKNEGEKGCVGVLVEYTTTPRLGF